MAPAACDTIIQNLEDFGYAPEDYSRIITGDLGYVGQSILFDLMRGRGYDIKKNHMDCGMTIFRPAAQTTTRGKRLRLRGYYAVGLYPSEADQGGMEADPICPHGSADVHRQLQRRCQRAGNRPWNRAGTLLAGRRKVWII